MGISYPRREFANLDISKGKKLTRSSINMQYCAECKDRAQYTDWRWDVLNRETATQATCNENNFFEVTTVFPRYILAHGARKKTVGVSCVKCVGFICSCFRNMVYFYV